MWHTNLSRVLALALTLLIAIIGCSGDEKPSDSIIYNEVRNHIRTSLGRNATLVSMEKTDGLKKADGSYIADFQVQISVMACAYFKREEWKMLAIKEVAGGRCQAPFRTVKRIGRLQQIGDLTHVLQKGEAAFVRKESGWVLTSVLAKPEDLVVVEN